MRTYSFVTVDVFTDRRFGGNPLEVFPEASGLSEGEMESLAAEMPVDLLAGCVGLDASDVVVAAHRPIVASVGNSFVIAEVAGSALSRAAPDIARFRAAVEAFPAL